VTTSRPLPAWLRPWQRLWLSLDPAERAGFFEGLRYFVPSLPAVFSWGLVTGVAMSKSVLTVPEAIGMSLLVYAGSAQLAVLPLFAAGLPLWTIWLTAIIVNLRFVIFSAALQPHFSHLSLRHRTVLGFFNGDLHFVYFMQRYPTPAPRPGKEGNYWGMALANCGMWQFSSILGIVLAQLFPDAWNLGLAGTLALIPVMVATINTRSMLMAVIIASVLALLCFDLPYRLGLVVAVVGAIAAGFTTDEIANSATLRRIRRRRAVAAVEARRASRNGGQA